MSDAPASILPRKISARGPNRARSGFTPDMLHVFCERAGARLGDVLDTRVKIVLDSVGVEPLADVVPEENATVCAALVDMNGLSPAASLLPDGDALFHLVDIMLGGDPEEEATVIERAPSSLTDRFCGTAADAVARALGDACDVAMGPGSYRYGGAPRVVREGAAMVIAPPAADVMAISLNMAFGPGARTGKLSLIVPLTTVDALSGGGGDGGTQPAYEDGPWFEHMKASVSMMELETMAVLHREQMSLAELSRLDIGSVLTLDREAVTGVAVVLTDGGDAIATGELGVASGRRVVSLADAPDAHFLAPMRKVIET